MSERLHIVRRADGNKSLSQHEYELKAKNTSYACFIPYFKNVTRVCETNYPERHNLYFWASDGVLPFGRAGQSDHLPKGESLLKNALRERRVLITGGMGFIGANLAHRLVDLQANVTLVDSLIPEYGGNLFNITGIENQVRVNISDVRDNAQYALPCTGARTISSIWPGRQVIWTLCRIHMSI